MRCNVDPHHPKGKSFGSPRVCLIIKPPLEIPGGRCTGILSFYRICGSYPIRRCDFFSKVATKVIAIPLVVLFIY
jgi:hypothetical protein